MERRFTMRKFVALLLACFMFGATSTTVFAQDTSLPDMLATAETAIYGQERTGSLLDRVAQLERDVYGHGAVRVGGWRSERPKG